MTTAVATEYYVYKSGNEYRLYSDDDADGEPLPMHWEICGICNGHGVSSAYLGALSWDDFDEQGPEFTEDYFKGAYDRKCECDYGKAWTLDWDALPLWQQDLVVAYHQELAAERRVYMMESGQW